MDSCNRFLTNEIRSPPIKILISKQKCQSINMDRNVFLLLFEMCLLSVFMSQRWYTSSKNDPYGHGRGPPSKHG